jgi:hypothetical protein
MKRLLIAFALLVLMLSGCLSLILPEPIRPDISLPFAVHKAGTTLTTEFETREKEHTGYRLELIFFIQGASDGVDGKRVRKLVGDYSTNADRQVIKSGIPIHMKINVRAIDASGKELNVIVNKEVVLDEGAYASGGSCLYKEIYAVVLPPGHYRVTIKSLKDIPELANTSVKFGVDNTFRK